ncbi:hypothetical protein H0Z60_18290 [Ectothiorhodospiraceae bacterium WFHF3C12]|nr:hypothetical protein [Ectothiorhodospiraceae bacterium WFHF3C12]
MRHSNTIKILGLALLVLFLAACKTQPVYNVDGAPVTTASEGQPTMEQVKQAIVRAGTSLGWRMEPARDGLIVATLVSRGHMAKVDINYTTSSYSINYKDSRDLDYDGEKIHKGYNRWIQNLDQRIRSRLIAL